MKAKSELNIIRYCNSLNYWFIYISTDKSAKQYNLLIPVLPGCVLEIETFIYVDSKDLRIHTYGDTTEYSALSPMELVLCKLISPLLSSMLDLESFHLSLGWPLLRLLSGSLSKARLTMLSSFILARYLTTWDVACIFYWTSLYSEYCSWLYCVLHSPSPQTGN